MQVWFWFDTSSEAPAKQIYDDDGNQIGEYEPNLQDSSHWQMIHRSPNRSEIREICVRDRWCTVLAGMDRNGNITIHSVSHSEKLTPDPAPLPEKSPVLDPLSYYRRRYESEVPIWDRYHSPFQLWMIMEKMNARMAGEHLASLWCPDPIRCQVNSEDLEPRRRLLLELYWIHPGSFQIARPNLAIKTGASESLKLEWIVEFEYTDVIRLTKKGLRIAKQLFDNL